MTKRLGELTEDHRRPITHKGVTYPSVQAFCRKFGLGQSAVFHRLSRGVTDEELSAKKLPRAKRAAMEIRET